MSHNYRKKVHSNNTYRPNFQTNVLDVASSLGYTMPDAARLRYLNDRFKGMEDNGMYAEADSIAQFALNNTSLSSFSLIDWKRTGVLYTISGGMTYTASGWEGNGTTGFINTNYNPVTGAINYSSNDASRSVVVYKAPAASATDYLDGNASSGEHMRASSSTQQRINGLANLNSAADLSGLGYTTITRFGANDVRLTKRDTEFIRTSAASGPANTNRLLLRSASIYGTSGLSLCVIGGAVTNTMIQADRVSQNKLFTKLKLTAVA